MATNGAPPDPAPHERRARRIAWLLALIAAAGLLAAWWIERGQPIYDDEIAFVRAARLAHVLDPERYVIPHPPLVVELQAAALALPLPDEQAARVVGLLAACATLALLPAAGHILLPGSTADERRIGWLAGGLAAVLYGAAPLAVQGASLLDIDNTWLTPVTLAFFVVWGAGKSGVRSAECGHSHVQQTRPARGFARVLALGVLFALALWTKLLTTPFLLIVLVVYALARRDWRGVGAALVIGLIGTVLFAATFGLYAIALRWPVADLAVTFAKSGDIGRLGDIARRAVQGGGILLFWLSLPLAVLWAWESLRAGARLLRGRVIALDGYALFAWMVLAFYLLVRELPYGFPRYHVPMLPALALMAAWPVARVAAHAGPRQIMVCGAAIVLALGYAVLVAGDPLLPQYRLTFETTDLMARVRGALQGLLIAMPVPLAAVAVALAAARPRERAGLIALALGCTGLAACLGADLVQARADYALRYSYGRVGTWDVVARVTAPDAPAGLSVAPLEILFHARRDGWSHYTLFCPRCRPADLLAVLEQRPAFVILTEKEDRRYTQVTEDAQVVARLEAEYSREIIGSYIVYARSASRAPRGYPAGVGGGGDVTAAMRDPYDRQGLWP